MVKSNLDVAFELVSKKKNPVTFSKLWEEVSQIQGYDEEQAKSKIGKFYTALTLDGRFITLGDNTWDLRDRYEFEKVHIDMNEAYSDEDGDNDSDVDEIIDGDEIFDDSEEEDSDDTEGEY